MSADIETLPFCVVKAKCPGPSKLVATCYGFTGGDKWSCTACKGYCVVRAQAIPTRPQSATVHNG